MSNNSAYQKYKVLEPLLLALAMIIGISLGYKINDTEDDFNLIERLDPNASPIGRIEEVLRFIDNKYVDSIDIEDLEDKLITSILDELDPHSVYIPPSELQKINRQMAGNYLGIGIETIAIRDTFYISRILPGSPAEEGGISIGDQILMLNDSIVAGRDYSYQQLSSAITEKDEVFIKVQNQSGKKELKLIPRELKLNSAKEYYKIENQVGYIKIERFTSKSYADFMKALETLVTQDKLDNLIIDLRDNPGGYLPEANKILSQLFKEKDRLLIYTEGEHSKKLEYKTSGKAFFDIENVIVLINEGSASGSEILAGAIQDWDRGLIMGEKSFGKGLVQEQYDLSNGGAIRLTVAKYYTPSGRLIQKSYDQYNRKSNENITENLEVDTATVFKTLIKKRSVVGGGGITPDIELTNDIVWYAETSELIEELKAISFLDFLDQETKFTENNFPLDEEYLEAMLFKLNDKFSASQLARNKKLLEVELNYYLAKLSLGERIAAKVDGQFDHVIQEALRTVKNEKSIVEILN